MVCNKKYKKEWYKEYYLKNKDIIKIYNKEYYLKNKETIKQKVNKYRIKNKEKIKQKKKLIYIKNRENILIKKRIYYFKNKAKIREKKLKNPEKYNKYNKYKIRKEYYKNYQKKQRKINVEFAIKVRLRSRLRDAFRLYCKNKTLIKKSSKKYGINWEKIILHLGNKPDNQHIWHIDHIKPLSSFDFSNPEQIKEAFKPENHQWLTAEENLKKSDKINYNYSNLNNENIVKSKGGNLHGQCDEL